MPDRVAETRHRPRTEPGAAGGRRAADATRPAAVAAGIVLAGALLAACSSSGETSFSLFADPGKYQYYTCVQIAAEMKNATRREQELKALMVRADQSTGGAAVGFIAYKADYVAASEELESLHAAARSKSCEQEQTWRSNSVIR
jgi:hypothetical protein